MWKNWEGEVPTTVSETIAKHEVSEDDYPNINTILTIVATLPVTSPDQLPKSATLPKWAMLFLIRQSQIQNNPIMHWFNENSLLFVC